MRDWIGTAVSLLGFVVVAVAFVRIMRARMRRSPSGPDQADPTSQNPLFELAGGGIVLEGGQLIQAHGWFWAILHMIVIGLLATGLLLIRRDRIRGKH